MATLVSISMSVYLLLGVVYLGSKKQSYNHLKHTISELGERGSVVFKLANYGLFLPVGLSLMLFALIASKNEVLQGLSICLSIGYALAAFFPCDPGSPIEGSWRQHIHNLAGFVQYAGGIYFLFQGQDYSLVAGIIFICLIFISFPQNPARGVAQRIAELLLFGILIHLTF
ncbi:hypothetical protein C900_00786 [Fulvivirga imtechensis AK7]|uniref:DUF998 domain-containing protein n=1 Tax=Fulvivirga imtechensis AK7 TaxID=1237149 RepID=L8JVK7_9BACT|nr:DUF998 domain-containing protein [Fulvivirga imtechensis]ELR72825.1 hypothetical protein C900_00786 [Fulvivirga imtechensis AK7]